MRRLAYLHLGMNPTASFKDAGMTVAMSRARATGAARCDLRQHRQHVGIARRICGARADRGGRARAVDRDQRVQGRADAGLRRHRRRDRRRLRRRAGRGACDGSRDASRSSTRSIRTASRGRRRPRSCCSSSAAGASRIGSCCRAGISATRARSAKASAKRCALGLDRPAAAARGRAGLGRRAVRARVPREGRARSGARRDDRDRDQDRRAGIVEEGARRSRRVARDGRST